MTKNWIRTGPPGRAEGQWGWGRAGTGRTGIASCGGEVVEQGQLQLTAMCEAWGPGEGAARQP